MECLKIDGLTIQHLFPELHFSLSLQLNAGEIIGISGPSGVGKSLLFKAIADLIPHYGTITLDNQDKNHFTAPKWRKNVMLVPPDSQWWHEHVAEHFQSANDTYFEWLGFDKSILSRSIHQLSSGEKQRLAILRAVQHKPEVLLLDEPTANLDSNNSAIIENFICDYAKADKAVLWISHNKPQIKRVASYMLEVTKEKVSKAVWK